MKAIDILNVVLRHTVDAPYTVEGVNEVNDSKVEMNGFYNIDEGSIEDQITLGLRTYFITKHVTTTLNPIEDGWYGYSVVLQRRPAFARVPKEVTR